MAEGEFLHDGVGAFPKQEAGLDGPAVLMIANPTLTLVAKQGSRGGFVAAPSAYDSGEVHVGSPWALKNRPTHVNFLRSTAHRKRRCEKRQSITSRRRQRVCERTRRGTSKRKRLHMRGHQCRREDMKFSIRRGRTARIEGNKARGFAVGRPSEIAAALCPAALPIAAFVISFPWAFDREWEA